MSLVHKKNTSGKALFHKLCGPEPISPYFSKGLFEEKSAFQNDTTLDALTFESHGIGRIQKVVSSLSDEDANNVSALALFARTQTTYSNIFGSYNHKYLEAWITSPKVSIQTINHLFVKIADSFKTFDEAIPALNIYKMFFELSICTNNPWTIKRSSKPGYQVIPYFEAAGELTGTMPSNTKDQHAYRNLVRKIKTARNTETIFHSKGQTCPGYFISRLADLYPPDRVHE